MSTNDSTTTTTTDAPSLPISNAPVFIADGGLETTLVFHQGIDLPDFAAFPLLDSDEGRAALRTYYEPYLDIAEERGVGIVLDTPTWRANPDWGPRLGYSREELAANNRRAVDFVRGLVAERVGITTVLNGAVGPRGDGYVVGEAMSAEEAASYHALQIRAFAEAGVDMVTSVTMTYVDEAVGIARAAATAGLPTAIGVTVETDGRLPSGTPLGEAIEAIDDATDGYPAYFMVNCAHPSHFADALTGDGAWRERVKAIRANASRLSHAELDEAEELDRGDVGELAEDYLRLHALLPDLRVVGGCCGTDHEHVAAIAAAVSG